MNPFKKIIDWYFTKKTLPYWIILLLDCAIVVFASYASVAIHYRTYPLFTGGFWPLTRTIALYTMITAIVFKVFRTYRGIIRYSSFADLAKISLAMFVASIINGALSYFINNFTEGQVFTALSGRFFVEVFIISVLLIWFVRVSVKIIYDLYFNADQGLRTLIYGVQAGGIGLAKNIRNEKPSKFSLKGFITHDTKMKDMDLLGEQVYMIDDKLPEIIEKKRIQALIVSPLRTKEFQNDQKLQDIFINAGVKVFMIQGASEWHEGDDFRASQLKEISIEDLLPRHEIQVDMEAVGEMLTGKNILITGAAGSIGSEMVRQVAAYKPAELMLIDNAETPLHDIRLMMAKEYPEVKAHTIVTTIAAQSRMEHIFEKFKPEYVFHAAAYKHVPMMENNPAESIFNNVIGTKIIADLAVKHGVRKFVMISTDKAVNPTNVMGCSKRICEIYVQSLDKAEKEGKVEGNTQFVTTRFGNVLGSNGSVIPLFEKQIKAGGPVTVTDPNIVRFFMLIPEACKLVLEAGTHGNGGEIFVFDMGDPVKIADLAKRMIKLSGADDVQIKYTGLRAGEKLYEEVLSNTENTKPSFHEKIRIAEVRQYDYAEVEKEIEDLKAIASTYDHMAVVAKMKQIVPEFKSQNSVYSELDS